MKIKFLLIFVFLYYHLFAQTSIKGVVLDHHNNILSGASVVLKHLQNNKIITYAIADFDGRFELRFKNPSDSLVLTASYLGYQTLSKTIKNQSQNIKLILEPSQEQLKTVKITASAITKYGDTLNYRVNAFKKEEDKAIIDVIRRLPGIDVRENGVIYYDGKPINKFYIENMDLLEGRYNLASNNLPAKQVASVQIYENHQPIKLLDSLQFSDRAALNIKLKKYFSYAFPVELAAGYKPVLWEAKLVPMIFTKKHQMLTVLQSNNTGKLLQGETLNLTKSYLTSIITDDNKWLHLSEVGAPPFKAEKYIDNTSFLISSNYLTKLKKNNFLKLNVSLISDYNEKSGMFNTTYFLPGDTLNSYQIKKNNYHHKILTSQFIFERNSKKTYLKNIFTYKYKTFEESGRLSNLNVFQDITYPLQSFTNEFQWSFPFGKQILSWYATLKYNSTNQNLEITPGQYTALLNDGQPYDRLQQFLDYKTFSGQTGFGFVKKLKRFTLSNQNIFNIDKSTLDTYININNPDLHILDNDYQNNISYSDMQLRSIFNLSYSKNNFRTTLDLPLIYQSLFVEDSSKDKSTNINRLFLDYELSTSYKLNYWNWTLTSQKQTNNSGLSQNYFGYILSSYQSLKKYDTPILQWVKNTYRTSIRYNNILAGFKAGLYVSYNEEERNLMYKYQYFANALTLIKAIETKNDSYSKTIKLNVSKYFTSIKTNSKILLLYNSSNKPVMINDYFKRLYYNTYELISQIDFPLSKHLSLYFTYQTSHINNRIDVLTKQHFINDIYIYPFVKKNHRIKITNDYYVLPKQYQQDNHWFINVSYRYKSKKRFETYIKLNNISNIKSYIDYDNTGYIFQKTVYTLRPFQVLCGFDFSF